MLSCFESDGKVTCGGRMRTKELMCSQPISAMNSPRIRRQIFSGEIKGVRAFALALIGMLGRNVRKKTATS